jgi:phage shock protein C
MNDEKSADGETDDAPEPAEPPPVVMPASREEATDIELEEPSPTVVGPSAGLPPKRLVRSRDDRVIAGVCGGLGEYLGVDSVLIRIAALILVFAGGAGVILYIIGWIAMPEGYETEPEKEAAPESGEAPERTRGAVLLGLVFVVLGVFFLVDEIWPDFLSWQYIWPVALIGIGIAILARARR